MAKRKYNGRKKWTKEELELVKKLSESYTKKDIAKGDFVAIEVLNGEILSVSVIIKAQANNW